MEQKNNSGNYYEYEKEIDIKELFLFLLKNIKYFIIFILIGFILFFGYTSLFIPPKYSSSVSMYVNNSYTSKTAGQVTINDINASQKLAEAYIIILNDGEVLSQVAKNLVNEYGINTLENFLPVEYVNGEKILSTKGIRDSIKMTSVNKTEILKIEAETKSPQLSASICNNITQVAPSVITRVVKAGSVETIGKAEPSNKISSPNKLKNGLIGSLIAFVILFLILFIRFITDNTIKSEEDLKKMFDIPVLSEIPDLNID